MISIDNAVELAVKTYLGLPERARGSKGPGRKEVDEASESFPALIELVERHFGSRLRTIDLAAIDWYHRLRNQLYHSGNGITVDRDRVEAYFQIASDLFESLFGFPPSINNLSASYTKTGEFLRLWSEFERKLRKSMPSKTGPAHYWKRDAIAGISEETVKRWDSVSRFRNELVHGVQDPSPESLDSWIRELRRLTEAVQARLRPPL